MHPEGQRRPNSVRHQSDEVERPVTRQPTRIALRDPDSVARRMGRYGRPRMSDASYARLAANSSRRKGFVSRGKSGSIPSLSTLPEMMRACRLRRELRGLVRQGCTRHPRDEVVHHRNINRNRPRHPIACLSGGSSLNRRVAEFGYHIGVPSRTAASSTRSTVSALLSSRGANSGFACGTCSCSGDRMLCGTQSSTFVPSPLRF